MSTTSSQYPLLIIVSDSVITGTTRLQKYGFLLHKQHRKELSKIEDKFDFEFYREDEWISHYYGPFCRQLETDIQICIDARLMTKTYKDIDGTSITPRHSLTMKGRLKWRELFQDMPKEMEKINDKITDLQHKNLYDLLRLVYKEYPQYTENSKLRELIELTSI